MPEQQRAMAMQRMQLQPGDPRLEQVIRIDSDITDMDIDVTIEEGIDIALASRPNSSRSLIQLAEDAAGSDPRPKSP